MIDSSAVRQDSDESAIGQAIGARAVAAALVLPAPVPVVPAAIIAPVVVVASIVVVATIITPVVALLVLVNDSAIRQPAFGHLRRARDRQAQNERAHRQHNAEFA